MLKNCASLQCGKDKGIRGENMTKHNRRYKESVFVDLFSTDKDAKARFLSLYNALHGTHLDSSTELKPLKLEQAMYTKLSNDVSCLIDNKIIVLADRWKNTVCL